MTADAAGAAGPTPAADVPPAAGAAHGASTTPGLAYRQGLESEALRLVGSLPREVAHLPTRAERALGIAERYARLLDADYCRFWWIDDTGTEARVVAHWPEIRFREPWEHVKRLDDEHSSVVATVMTTGRLRVASDTAEIPEDENRFAQVYKVLSGTHVPMFVGERVVGDMVACSTRERHHFVEADEHVLRALAAAATFALADLPA